MEKNSKNLFWHISGCLAFLVIPILLSPRPPHMPLFSAPTLRDLYANVLMLIIFYLNYYVFIPKLYFTRKNLAYASLIVLGFVVIIILPSLMTGHVPWENPRPPRMHGPPPMHMRAHPNGDFTLLEPVKHNIFLYIAVILFSIFLRVRTKLLHTEVLKQDAEIGTLKNQINPHFLFNTLNNIYAFAIREKAASTATSILKLSAMMRYVVTETAHEFVALQKEINYTNDYIDLQRMRLTTTLQLSYHVSGEIAGQKIAPMILMPFIENAFKHGVNPDQDSYINILVTVSASSLELIVENQKVKTSTDMHDGSGVGIENTKARLDMLYSKKYTLLIHDDQEHYRVKLNLQLS